MAITIFEFVSIFEFMTITNLNLYFEMYYMLFYKVVVEFSASFRFKRKSIA